VTHSEYKAALVLRREMDRNGLILRMDDCGMYVSPDIEHENWKDFGFIKNARLSARYTTIEEIYAFVDGFIAMQTFFDLRENKGD
jgi:hypothetical protein